MKPNPPTDFETIRSFFEEEHLATYPIPRLAEDTQKLHWKQIQSYFSELRSKQTSFFSKFDYGWAFEQTSYTHIWEALLQYYILQILTELPEKHPHFKNAGNICIRLVNNQNIGPSTYFTPNASYIIFPQGLAIFMRNWAMFALELIGIGPPNNIKDLRPDYELNMSNNIYGLKMYYSLAGNIAACIKPSHDFFKGLLKIAENIPDTFMQEVTIHEQIDKIEEKTGEHGVSRIFYSVLDAEVFIVCHELAHALIHREYKRKGLLLENLTIERQADHSGASLFMIHKAKNLESSIPYPVGPALFFRLTDIYISARIVAASVQSKGKSEHLLLQSLKEIRERQKAFILTMREYGNNDIKFSGLYLEIMREANVTAAWFRTYFQHLKDIANHNDIITKNFDAALDKENDWRLLAYPREIANIGQLAEKFLALLEQSSQGK